MKWWIMLKCWLLHQFTHIASDTSIRRAIPGEYKRQYQNGSVLIQDTLTITQLSVLADTYQVERKIVNTYPEDHWEQQIKKDKWVAVYHTLTRQLVRGVSGRIFSFVPEQGILLFEDKEYRKWPDWSAIDPDKL
jgi:hypothetical protein